MTSIRRLAFVICAISKRDLTEEYQMRQNCLMTKSLRLSSRDAIIEAAFAVFSKNPGAPLADVAGRAGVGRATLHRHFASRETCGLTPLVAHKSNWKTNVNTVSD